MAKILLIDDDMVVRLFMENIFAGTHDVKAFPCWSSAFKSISAKDFDLMLIDINLAGFRGQDIVKMLGKQKETKVVLFSAMDKSDMKRIAQECGADGYIQKVLNLEQLEASLKPYLN
jgi:DNA-binding NtrC family response regulator